MRRPRRPGSCSTPSTPRPWWAFVTERSSPRWSIRLPESARWSPCGSRTTSSRAGGPGSDFTRRAASTTRCPATTASRSSRRLRESSGHRGGQERSPLPHGAEEVSRPHSQSDDDGQRLANDSTTSDGGRHQDRDLLPLVQGDRDHRPPGGGRDAGEGTSYGGPREPAHDQALRPDERRDHARRSGKNRDLSGIWLPVVPDKVGIATEKERDCGDVTGGGAGGGQRGATGSEPGTRGTQRGRSTT